MTDQKRAIVYGLAAVALWSTVATAFKITLRSMSAMELVWWASMVSLIMLVVIVVASGRMKDLRVYLRAHWRRSLLLGAINPFLYYAILFRAYEMLPAQEAQSINYTWALVLTFLSVPMLGHRLNGRDIFAGLLGYMGVLIIATHGDLLSLTFGNLPGVGLALLSTVLWALYWILNTKASSSTIVVLTANFGAGVLLMTFYLLWQEGFPHDLTLSGGLGALYIGLFEMSVTFLLWGKALKLTHKTATVANLIFLSPVLSLGLIHFVLGEAITLSTVAALGLILFGLLVQQK